MRFPLAALALLGAISCAHAEKIGEVVTNYRPFSPSDTISIDSFKDPRVPGVACHVSRAVTGGMGSLVGMSEDKAEASLACRQVGPITVALKDLKGYEKEDVFSASQSVWFKKMRVRRFIDIENNTIIYLVYSDYLIDGSPKNAISSVPVMPWGR